MDEGLGLRWGWVKSLSRTICHFPVQCQINYHGITGMPLRWLTFVIIFWLLFHLPFGECAFGIC